MTTYTKHWFAGQVTTAATSAEVAVPLIIDLIRPTSVVDVGCGLGAWLAAFARHGITDIQGVDGDYVDRASLQIPPERFRPHDLTRPLPFDRRFDLAISLEVGEHLPHSAADGLVDALTALAPVVVFSAAVPGQGGNRHINEQWPSYWAAMFERRGFRVADPFRPAWWMDDRVEWWYRQNMLLYVSPPAAAASPRLAALIEGAAGRPLDIVHPAMFDIARSAAANPARTLVRRQLVGLRQTVRRLLPG